MRSPVSIRRREVLPMTCTERRKTDRLPAPPEAACAPSCLFLRPSKLDITNSGVLSCGPPSRPRWLVLTNHVHNLPQTSGLVKPLFSFSKSFSPPLLPGRNTLRRRHPRRHSNPSANRSSPNAATVASYPLRRAGDTPRLMLRPCTRRAPAEQPPANTPCPPVRPPSAPAPFWGSTPAAAAAAPDIPGPPGRQYP